MNAESGAFLFDPGCQLLALLDFSCSRFQAFAALLGQAQNPTVNVTVKVLSQGETGLGRSDRPPATRDGNGARQADCAAQVSGT
jgi:hypothetical protein